MLSGIDVSAYQVMSGSGTVDIIWPTEFSGGWTAAAQVFTAGSTPPPAASPSGLLLAGMI